MPDDKEGKELLKKAQKADEEEESAYRKAMHKKAEQSKLLRLQEGIPSGKKPPVSEESVEKAVKKRKAPFMHRPDYKERPLGYLAPDESHFFNWTDADLARETKIGKHVLERFTAGQLKEGRSKKVIAAQIKNLGNFDVVPQERKTSIGQGLLRYFFTESRFAGTDGDPTGEKYRRYLDYWDPPKGPTVIAPRRKPAK